MTICAGLQTKRPPDRGTTHGGTVGAPDCRNVVDCGDPDHEDKANAAFIAAAREAVPDLLDELDTELDYWMGRAYKAEKQAYRTQARHEQNPYWQREARAQRHRADDYALSPAPRHRPKPDRGETVGPHRHTASVAIQLIRTSSGWIYPEPGPCVCGESTARRGWEFCRCAGAEGGGHPAWRCTACDEIRTLGCARTAPVSHRYGRA